MFQQTSPTIPAQQVPQNQSNALTIGSVIRWPLGDNPDEIALIVDIESIAGWQVLTIAPGVGDHGQPVRPGILRLSRLDEVRQSGLLRPVRFELGQRFSIAPSHPALATTQELPIISHLCESALERLHDQRARLHALRDIAAARREERRAERRGDRRTGWRAMPRTSRPQGAQEGRR